MPLFYLYRTHFHNNTLLFVGEVKTIERAEEQKSLVKVFFI
jgi:hypothetical protein